MSVLLVFVDGVGLGTPGAHNPFDGAARSVLRPLSGRRDARGAVANGWHLRPLDAGLGVPGLPQSASGTATILTGLNVPALLGEHLWAFPDARVRALLAEHSVLRRAREHGLRSAYLNAFPHELARPDAPVRRGACTCAALAGGGALYTLDALDEGYAALFDVTHEWARARGLAVPLVSTATAAARLARGAQAHDLALFELFLTDKAGHSQQTLYARREVERTERLLEALTAALDPTRDTLVVTSDHGNLEDLSTRGHTDAKVPALAWGLDAATLVEPWVALTDVAPALLALALRRAAVRSAE